MFENVTQSKKPGILLYLIVFAIIIVDSGFYAINVLNGTTRFAISLIAVFLTFFCSKKNQLDIRGLICCCFLVIYLIMHILPSKNISQNFTIMFFVVLAYVFTTNTDQKLFIKYFSDIMFFLAIFSLVTHIISTAFPSVVELLPTVVRGGGVLGYRNAIFSIIYTSYSVNRNFGIFWEPGAFSIFLNIALLFELFHNKPNVKRIVIFSITIITTLSTLGVISMALLYMASLFKNSSKANKKIKVIVSVLLLFGIIYFLFYDMSFIDEVFGKLESIGSDTEYQTTAVRLDSIKYPGREFLSSPVWGIGFQNFLEVQTVYCRDMATFTFINWLCIYGVIGGIVPILGTIQYFVKFGDNIITKMILFGFSLFVFSTENFVQIMFIYILIFYGLQRKEYEESPVYSN